MNRLAAVFVSGRQSEGVLFVCIIGDRVIGADIFGVEVDGHLHETAGGYDLSLTLKVPAGGTIVQGATAPDDGMSYNVQAQLPLNVDELPFVEIGTPFGPVNARFQFLREFDLEE